MTEADKQGKGKIRAVISWYGGVFTKAFGAGHIQGGANLIRETAEKLSPAKYKPSKFKTWAYPERNQRSFRSLMREHGITETDIAARHRVFAICAYVSALVASAAITWGVTEVIGGHPFKGFAGIVGGSALSMASLFKYSLAAMQIRDRNLNVGWVEWLSRKWEWIPPLDAPARPRKLKRKDGGEREIRPDGRQE